MQPSSLVFVAIVAVWVAYLIPHWLRRRDQLVHEQQGEQAAVGRRVLEPRRAVAHATGGSAGVVHVTRNAPQPAPAGVPAKPVAPDVPVVTAVRGAVARRRALVLIGLVLATGGFWVAAVTTTLLWWACLPITVLLVLDVAAVVAGARQRARSRARMAGIRAETRRRELQEAAAAAQVARLAQAAAAARQEKAAVPDGTWVPVPVPPPTYTLKQSVRRPEPALLDVPVEPVAAARTQRADGPQWDELVARRVVNG